MGLSELIQRIRPCDTNQPYVFISYSSADRELVWNDVCEFQRRGYNIWLDEKNLDKTKDSWKQDALTAIEDMECMLLVFYVSGNSLRSDACFRELCKTVADSTKAMHFGPVKFIAVDAEPVGDITAFTQKVFESIRNSGVEKEERRKQALALDGFMRQFFNSNNEKVRVHPKDEVNRKMDYYEEILAAFPDSTRICPEEPVEAEPEPEPKPEVVAEEAEEEPEVVAEEAEEEPEVVAEEAEEEPEPEPEAAVEAEPELEPEVVAEEPVEEEPEVVAEEAEEEPEVAEEAEEEPEVVAEEAEEEPEPEEAFFTMPQKPEPGSRVYGDKTFYARDFPSARVKPGIYRIPEGYTDVEVLFGGNIFQRVGDVTVLELPDSIKKDIYLKFTGCEGLREIRLPRYMEKFASDTFKDCRALKKIEIPGGVTDFGSNGFKGCVELEEVKLPFHLSEIGMSTFEGCLSLEHIKLPPGLTKIGLNAFYGCRSLKEIELPAHLKRIDMNAFRGCESLQRIELPPGVEKVESDCFRECSSLREVIIPGTINKIPGSMFEDCGSLQKVVIGDGTEVIGSAFERCGKELHIWIPESVRKIAGFAFYETDAVIHCKEDSVAHKYALKKKMSYVLE